MEIKVGEIIRAKREEKKIGLVELARRIEVSPGYLSQLEHGRKRNPKMEIVMKLMQELDVDLSMLLGMDTNEESYLARIPPLLKLVIARERNLNVLSDPQVLKKYCTLSEKLFDARYVLEDKALYDLFLEDAAQQVDLALKRYLALRMIQGTRS